MVEFKHSELEELPRLLSIKQACRLLGVGRSNLYEMLALGRVRSVKIGRRRLVPRDAIDEFVGSFETG
jgi:excisionase family DNA binding protein